MRTRRLTIAAGIPRWRRRPAATALGGFALLAVLGVIPLAVLAHQTSFFNVGVIPLV